MTRLLPAAALTVCVAMFLGREGSSTTASNTTLSISPSSRQHRAVRVPQLSGLIYNRRLVWAAETRSLLQCLRDCASKVNCTAFTFTPAIGQVRAGLCRGHNASYGDNMWATNSSTSSTYMMTSRINMTLFVQNQSHATTTTTPTATQASTAFYGSTCQTKDNCPQAMGEWMCYLYKCACGLGNHFKTSTQTCVATCERTQLTEHFLRYEGAWLTQTNHLKTVTGIPEEECDVLCKDDSACYMANVGLDPGSSNCTTFGVPTQGTMFPSGFTTGAPDGVFKIRKCL